jgi:hypothetical protein
VLRIFLLHMADAIGAVGTRFWRVRTHGIEKAHATLNLFGVPNSGVRINMKPITVSHDS